MKRVSRSVIVAVATSLVLAACGGSGGGGADTTTPSAAPAAGSAPSGSRPSSPAVVKILQPTDGATVSGPTVHVVVSLKGAEIVAATTTNVVPTQGHLHLYVDNVLVSMNYGTTQDIPVNPGTYVLKVEFVASDHAPFNPRVWSPQVLFTVK